MRLDQLAAAVPETVLEAGPDYEVRRVTQDSRTVEAGDLFVAVSGLRVDGHDFAVEAARRGAAIAVESPVVVPEGTPMVRVPSTRIALARLAAEIAGRPARGMRMIGITGTDGKTTVTHMVTHVLRASGRRVGAMSSVSFQIGDEETDNVTGQSTTEAPQVQARLRSFVEAGAEAAVIEVTSHALVQERVGACDFDIVGFTNIGHDHLDYHGSQDAYQEAKARLIDICRDSFDKGVPKTAVLNHDDGSFDLLSRKPIARQLSYSRQQVAAVRAVDVRLAPPGTAFRLLTESGEIQAQLEVPALFNVSNALCTTAVCLAAGLRLEEIAHGLGTFHGVRGRMETVYVGQDFNVFIDFAHAAGALGTVLGELRPLTRGRLLAVFGATARSDHDRPGMGAAAAKSADFFIITTDDPVDEDPAELAREVQMGVAGRQPGLDYEVVLDRRAAIRRVMSLAKPGDTVLLAGKGHERSMVYATGAEPWDERAEAEAAIREVIQ